MKDQLQPIADVVIETTSRKWFKVYWTDQTPVELKIAIRDEFKTYSDGYSENVNSGLFDYFYVNLTFDGDEVYKRLLTVCSEYQVSVKTFEDLKG